MIPDDPTTTAITVLLNDLLKSLRLRRWPGNLNQKDDVLETTRLSKERFDSFEEQGDLSFRFLT